MKFYEGLTVDFCKKENAKYILRGLRDSHDFKFEKGIAQMNNNLNSEVNFYVVQLNLQLQIASFPLGTLEEFRLLKRIFLLP